MPILMDEDGAPSTTDPSTELPAIRDRPATLKLREGVLCRRVAADLDVIVRIFRDQWSDLPAEVTRDKFVRNRGEILKGIDIYLRWNVLDDFLRKHDNCRKLLAEIYGSRYPYLLSQLYDEQQSTNAEKRTTRQRRAKNLRKEIGKDINLERSSESSGARSGQARLSGSLSLAELGFVEKTLATTRTLQHSLGINVDLQGKAQPSDKGLFAPLEFDELAFSSIVSPLGHDVEVESSPPEHASRPLDWETIYPNDKVPGNWTENKAIRSEEDLETFPYKGWNIDGPAIQLARAKNFLADEDTDRTPNWQRKFAELTEYFTYLLHIWKGEDWGTDLREAIDMLHVHWAFETYHYGRPKLLLDFPNRWHVESSRLPGYADSNLVSREAVRSQPAQTKHKMPSVNKVASAHDVQYNIPTDILEKVYLPQYKKHAIGWIPKPGTFATSTPYSNLANQENIQYEKCMREGLAGAAMAFKKEGGFEFHPEDIVQERDGYMLPKGRSLQSFAQFRGRKRAALQECLSAFDNKENRAISNSWRVVVLPDKSATGKPKPEKVDAGIIFKPVTVKAIRKDKARDPLSYTIQHGRYKNEDLKWAEWVKNHAIKQAYGHQKWMKSKDPIISLPLNWKGPISPALMDQEMAKTWETLKRYRLLHLNLIRASRRTPRDFIHQVLLLAEKGFQKCHDLSSLTLKFRPDEYAADGSDDLLLLRPKEEEWLRYLSHVPDTSTAELDEESDEPLDWRAQLLLTRTMELLSDSHCDNLFRLEVPVKVEDFLTAVNRKVGGPVKRHEFTLDDLREDLPKLVARHVLQHTSYVIEHRPGCLVKHKLEGSFLSQCKPKALPEDMIKLVKPDVPKVDEPALEVDISSDDLNDDIRSIGSNSTTVNVPASGTDSTEYTKHMPEGVIMDTWEEDRETVQRHQAESHMFFRCLAYRLGMTLRVFEQKYNQVKQTLSKPHQQKRLLSLIEAETDFWLDDSRKLPEDSRRNPKADGVHRVRWWYKDIVKEADPEKFDPEWVEDRLELDEPCRELVRKGILREVYENKTVLWPSKLRAAKDVGGKPVTPPRREPVWAFGHPKHKTKAPRFWDINRWPVHLQSPQTQEIIRKSGPRPKKNAVDIGVNQTSPSKDLPQQEMQDNPLKTASGRDLDYTVTYADAARSRKTVLPDMEYWLGETPLQRKTFERRMRSRFETTTKKTWTERVTDSFFSKHKRKRLDHDSLPLPKVRSILKSVPPREEDEDSPRKKRRVVDAILLDEYSSGEEYLTEYSDDVEGDEKGIWKGHGEEEEDAEGDNGSGNAAQEAHRPGLREDETESVTHEVSWLFSEDDEGAQADEAAPSP